MTGRERPHNDPRRNAATTFFNIKRDIPSADALREESQADRAADLVSERVGGDSVEDMVREENPHQLEIQPGCFCVSNQGQGFLATTRLSFSGRLPPPIYAGSNDPLLKWALRQSGAGLTILASGSSHGLREIAAGRAMLRAATSSIRRAARGICLP